MNIAEEAHEAYRRHTGGRSLASGQPIPPWADLPPAIQGAWQVAAAWVAGLVTGNGSHEHRLFTEVNRLTADVAELTRRLAYTYCAYCGDEIRLDDLAATDKIAAHIAACEKHPLTAAASENLRLRADRDVLLSACRLWDQGFTDGEQFDEPHFLKWVNDNRRAARAAIAAVEGVPT